MKPLAAMFPPGPIGMDFWTLTGYAPTIEQGIGKLLTIPRDHLLAEMEGDNAEAARLAQLLGINGALIDQNRELAGKIASGYAFQVFHHGRLVAEGAEGWARRPSEPRFPALPSQP